jgi:hypothetical protein
LKLAKSPPDENSVVDAETPTEMGSDPPVEVANTTE